MGGIRKGDTVIVLSGKDRGKTGKVLSVFPDRMRVLVERVNMLKHFDRRTQQNQAGGVIEREAALHVAKLALMCPKCRKPSRRSVMVSADGTRQRVCHRCKSPLGTA